MERVNEKATGVTELADECLDCVAGGPGADSNEVAVEGVVSRAFGGAGGGLRVGIATSEVFELNT